LAELDPVIYPVEQVQKAQYELAKGTNLIDYAEQLADQVKHLDGVKQGLPGESRRCGRETRCRRELMAYCPSISCVADFENLRKLAIQKTASLQESAAPVLRVIEDPAVVDRLKGAVDKLRNMELLEREYGLTLEQVNALYYYGHYQYTYGDYLGASSYLYHFLILSPSLDLNVSAHWGKLLSDTLAGEWDAALSGLKELREMIDNPLTEEQAKPSVQLQARSWLLHWGLFVFFNHEDGRAALLDIFLSPPYLNTLQTSCPHLTRYLVAAAILTHRTNSNGYKVTIAGRQIRNPIQEITKIVLQENHHYADPITSFLSDLYGEFDFEKAQEKLKDAKTILENDFFLNGFVDEFMEGARWLVSEVYCKIHRRIDIT
jgi:translation initiation factor 3 subunit E